MPTEATFLLAGLFFLAAALGYFFARFGDDEEDKAPPEEEAGAGYLKGLNHLLENPSDQALDVYMRVAAVDDETLDTHFALGALFRRRGETERAIRVHQSIVDRPKLQPALRERALSALAEDHLSAGLLDRAEQLYTELSELPGSRRSALEQLLRIYEISHEWQQAIRVSELLPEEPGEGAQPAALRTAHYHCELAEEAIGRGEFTQARSQLDIANQSHAGPRTGLLLAALQARQGNAAAAVRSYVDVACAWPHMAAEIVPRLAECCCSTDAATLLSDALAQVRAQPGGLQAIAIAVVGDSAIDVPEAQACLRDYVLQQPVLQGLIGSAELRSTDPAVWLPALVPVREAMRRMLSSAQRFRCSRCGYAGAQMAWQCPGCRNWETVRPDPRLVFTPEADGSVSG